MAWCAVEVQSACGVCVCVVGVCVCVCVVCALEYPRASRKAEIVDGRRFLIRVADVGFVGVGGAKGISCG